MMKLLFDFFPIVLFFIAFKLYNLYIATVVLIAVIAIQVAYVWIRYRKVEKPLIFTAVAVFVLGGLTLAFHDPMFIKWKPTVIYWLMTLLLIGSQYIGGRPIIRRLMDGKLSLPAKIWVKINFSWAIFFLLMGIANLIVVYNFSTSAWVNFKLFGTLGLTIIFIILQAIYMARHSTTPISTGEKTANKTKST